MIDTEVTTDVLPQLRDRDGYLYEVLPDGMLSGLGAKNRGLFDRADTEEHYGPLTEVTGMNLITARTNDDTESSWTVHDTDRATSLTIIRGTSDGVRQAQALSMFAANFTDVETGTVLSGVFEHRRVGEDFDGSEACTFLGRCDSERFVSAVANPLFHAAAAAAFDDAAVFALLAELHAKAGAR